LHRNAALRPDARVAGQFRHGAADFAARGGDGQRAGVRVLQLDYDAGHAAGGGRTPREAVTAGLSGFFGGVPEIDGRDGGDAVAGHLQAAVPRYHAVAAAGLGAAPENLDATAVAGGITGQDAVHGFETISEL